MTIHTNREYRTTPTTCELMESRHDTSQLLVWRIACWPRRWSNGCRRSGRIPSLQWESLGTSGMWMKRKLCLHELAYVYIDEQVSRWEHSNQDLKLKTKISTAIDDKNQKDRFTYVLIVSTGNTGASDVGPHANPARKLTRREKIRKDRLSEATKKEYLYLPSSWSVVALVL